MTPEELKKLTREFKLQAEYQKEVSQSFSDYVEGVKKYKQIQETLKNNDKVRIKLQKELKDAQNRQNADDIKAAEAKLKIIEEQTEKIKQQGVALENALKSVNKTSLAGAEAAAKVLKGLGKNFLGVPDAIKTAFGKIQNLGLFDMDKAVKQSALQMGLLNKQSKGYTSTIRLASETTNNLGIDIKELAKMQAGYSEELGRTVMLGQSGLIAMGEMAAATSLGAEGAARMAAEMETQGLSAERTRDFVEQTMNDSSKMGTNATKVVKNIQNNIKMLNRYNFKDGVKGLGKMAQLVSKLGVDMEFAAGFADKLWNIEGAVEMSAQLQVLGGEWSKLADPFRLMYMARNDMAGLTEEIANAAAASAKFDEKTKEFKIGAMEMHRLKIVAEQTGMSYDELTTAAKNAAKFSKIKSQVSFAMDDEAKEFIANTAKLDEKGRAYIEVDGEPKFLNQLGSAGRDVIKQQIQEKKSLAERAKSAQSFDESFANLMNLLKTSLLPVVDGLNDVLKPFINDIFKNKEFKDELRTLGQNIGSVVKTGAEVVKYIGDLAVQLGPTGTLATVLGVKAMGWLLDKANWFTNGIFLAKGFNSMASVGGSGKGMGIGESLADTALLGKGGKGKLAKTLLPKLGKTGTKIALGGAKLASGAASMGAGFLGDYLGGKTSDALGIKQNTGGDIGSILGGIAGGALGTLIPIPGVGTALGAAAGSYLGKLAGDAIGDSINDGVIPNLGSDFSKGRAIIQGGKVHPIDNKDDLMAMKPGGVVDKTINNTGSSSVTHVFEPITINGEIILKTPGDTSISIDILKDAQFKRDITRIIQVEVEKNKNGGKNRG
jgi:hypothetical protein